MSFSCRHQNLGKSTGRRTLRCGSIAQGLEHWSCKPGVASSNLAGAWGKVPSLRRVVLPALFFVNTDKKAVCEGSGEIICWRFEGKDYRMGGVHTTAFKVKNKSTSANRLPWSSGCRWSVDLRIFPLATCLTPQCFLCFWSENCFADYSGTAQSRSYADRYTPIRAVSALLLPRTQPLRPSAPAYSRIQFTLGSTLWRFLDLRFKPELQIQRS